MKLLMVGFICILINCRYSKIEQSETLHEDAIIADAIFTPSVHKTVLRHSFEDEPGHVSMNYDGNMGVSIGNGLQVTSVTNPEVYGILFRCQHGSFVVQGSQSKHKELYTRLKNSVNQKVDILYKENYLATYDDLDKDKKYEMVSRVLTDYDFLDANLK